LKDATEDMAYTVFDDDAESILPQKAVKASPKKQRSPAKHVNGHTDTAPFASTSSAVLPPAKPDASNEEAEDEGHASAVFKKRKASTNGISQSHSKSRIRSPEGETGLHLNGSDLSKDKVSLSHSKAPARETPPLITSKRVATFYDQEDNASDGEEASPPGKARGLDVRAGESKKQARKRQQADRKDKAEHLLTARQKLPVYAVRDAILKEIEERDTVVILGETGSGKTTRECIEGKVSARFTV
jgi:HrpA-like RNA helicase